jgi:type VI secretion system protein ImpL
MSLSGGYLLSAVLFAVYAGLSWVTVGLLHLSGNIEMLVRMLLLGLGLGALAWVYHWHTHRRNDSQYNGARSVVQNSSQERELDHLVREAEAQLAGSCLGREARLGNLPLIYLLGEAGSAKTAAFVHSETNPDLLAGQVYQGESIIPTRPANLWLARKVVFAEAGGRLLEEPARWFWFVKRLAPARLRSLFGARQPAPRVALVCVSCEAFLKVGADESLAALARQLQIRLGEISHALGTSVPVYVLFTKLDRMAHFTEFVANLTDEEAAQALGVTLPFRPPQEAGVHGEIEARRVTAAFDALLDSLAEKRLALLRREHEFPNRAHAYEFPREFRKLRNHLVRFLVDLTRPSQLRANPFLRGFYFSGVRPIVVKDRAPAAGAPAAARAGHHAGATGLFLEEELRAPAQAFEPAGSVRTRRTAQWLFLSRLFHSVILEDYAAMASGGLGSRTERIRRIALACASAVLVLCSVGMTVSFFRNRALAAQCEDAARGIAQSETGGASEDLPSRTALQRLDALRQSVETLSLYRREGAPLTLRWGLYLGDDLYPAARRLYFNRFHQLLFGSTQASLLRSLRALPDQPGLNDEYRPVYDTLKAYLITTSHHEKSTRAFLAPLLDDRWAASRQVDPERAALARRQFEFYSEELHLVNPFSSDNDGAAVEHARAYLARFNAVESVYQFMLAEAGKQNPPVNFNRQFPGSAAYLLNDHDVPGPFSLAGWKFMNDAITHARRFFGGEQWVLGDRSYGDLDPERISPELRARYQKDFLANWRDYLSQSQVLRYRSIADAALKLNQLSSNQSYLLKLFCLATVNTSVDFDDAKTIYQPVHFVEPPGCTERYIRDSNSVYIGALVNLQTSLERVAKEGGSKEDLLTQTATEAANAHKAVRQVAANFRIDAAGNIHGLVEKLMEDPITYAEAVLGQIGPAELNAEGKRLCGQFSELTDKYPFNTASRVDATLDEVNAIFRPGDGRLSAFYESKLRNYVERQGASYIRNSGSRVGVTDPFLRFFNRAMAFSDAVYKRDAQAPSLTYNMRALPAEGLHGVTLNLDGQVLKTSGQESDSKDFTWPGPGVHGARLSGNLGGGDLSFITYEGLWAAFRFFGDADRFQSSGSTYTLEWVPRQGQSGQPIRLDSGKVVALPFVLDLKGTPPVFQRGYLSGLTCVSEVAR